MVNGSLFHRVAAACSGSELGPLALWNAFASKSLGDVFTTENVIKKPRVIAGRMTSLTIMATSQAAFQRIFFTQVEFHIFLFHVQGSNKLTTHHVYEYDRSLSIVKSVLLHYWRNCLCCHRF